MVAIIDYDAGNIRSVEKAVALLGHEAAVTGDRETILSADHVILPGVGAFGDAMDKLQKSGLVGVIHEAADQKIPFLGICLGLQLMFESSQESEGVEGEGVKIPHIGWNSLSFPNPGRLFQGIAEGAYVYFVHSYYLQAGDPQIVTAATEYGTLIHASVERDNLFACQFHPEKSSETGLKILENFLNF